MLNKGDVLLLDIEGTVTSITFVKDILFPYVRNNLKQTLEKNWESEDFQNDIDAIRCLTADEIAKGDSILTLIPDNEQEKHVVIDAVCRNVFHWMDKDLKLTALKQLQGHVWRKAYQCGLIKSQYGEVSRGRKINTLYPDVIPVLKHVTESGIKVYIYSSGSVEAQKLLFAYTVEGDITSMISGYFDTNIGLKTEAKSYLTISEEIGVEPNKILFLTDVEREAYPCKEAGYKCVLIVREGNDPLSEHARKDFQIAENLDFLL